MEQLSDNAASNSSSIIERVIRTYLSLTSAKEPVGITDIASELQLGKTTVHRILQYLVQYELAERNPHTRKYQAGPRAYSIALDQQANDSLHTLARPYMDYLFELTVETITLCKRFGFHNVYIGQIESSKEIHISVPLGEDVPLTVGSNGLCQLAFLDEQSVDLVLSLPRHKVTEDTVTDEQAIRQRLSQIRQNGYSFTSGERVASCAGVAVPILVGNPARPIGAIGVAFLDSRFPELDEKCLINEIKMVARLIERQLTQVNSLRQAV